MIRFWLHFAARSLIRRRKRTVITLAGVMIGVAVLVVLGAIMIGVGDAMVANSISIHTGHILIQGDDTTRLLDWWAGSHSLPVRPKAILPRLLVPAFISSSGSSKVTALQLVGVMPERERKVTAIPATISAGTYLAVKGRERQIVVGDLTAAELEVVPGDSIQLTLANRSSLQARVAGVFHTGISHLDRGVAHILLPELAGQADAKGEVALFFERGVDSRLLAGKLQQVIPEGQTASPWEELLPELEQLTRLNLVSMGIVIILVVAMMAAGLTNTILISVMDRLHEFGVLKALGVTPAETRIVILAESALLCLAAGSLGIIIGLIITYTLGRTGIDLSPYTSANPHFVMSSIVYPRCTWQMTLLPSAAALLAGIVSSLWPAWIAGRQSAAGVMRGEI